MSDKVVEFTDDEAKRLCLVHGGRSYVSDMLRRKLQMDGGTWSGGGTWVVRLSPSEASKFKDLWKDEGPIDGGSSIDSKLAHLASEIR